jgi:hypothetical protein
VLRLCRHLPPSPALLSTRLPTPLLTPDPSARRRPSPLVFASAPLSPLCSVPRHRQIYPPPPVHPATGSAPPPPLVIAESAFGSHTPPSRPHPPSDLRRQRHHEAARLRLPPPTATASSPVSLPVAGENIWPFGRCSHPAPHCRHSPHPLSTLAHPLLPGRHPKKESRGGAPGSAPLPSKAVLPCRDARPAPHLRSPLPVQPAPRTRLLWRTPTLVLVTAVPAILVRALGAIIRF